MALFPPATQPPPKLCQAALLFPFPVNDPVRLFAEPRGLPTGPYEHSSAIGWYYFLLKTIWFNSLIFHEGLFSQFIEPSGASSSSQAWWPSSSGDAWSPAPARWPITSSLKWVGSFSFVAVSSKLFSCWIFKNQIYTSANNKKSDKKLDLCWFCLFCLKSTLIWLRFGLVVWLFSCCYSQLSTWAAGVVYQSHPVSQV